MDDEGTPPGPQDDAEATETVDPTPDTPKGAQEPSEAESPQDWRKQRWARGHRKLALIQALAEGKKSQKEIGLEFGISHQAVSWFKLHNRAAVEAQAKDLEDEFAAVWVAQKRNRVQEYQDALEALSEVIAQGNADPAVVRAHAQLLRNVAEEMGQLPSRQVVQVQQTPTQYTLGITEAEMEAL